MKKPTMILILVLIILTVTTVSLKVVGSSEKVEVIHWSNGHLMRPGLLPDMATKFNQANHRTITGKKIEVKIVNHGSAEQADDLLSRVVNNMPVERDKPNPVIVTPSSADWLVRVNQGAGRKVVDTGASKSIASALIGIVTYRDMAEILGWPEKEIGYADIISLRENPDGWSSYPSAKAEWGQRPLFAFTDPVTSSTGRSVLFSLYAIAAEKAPEELTLEDVTDPKVVNYVKQFQELIDHYMIGTIPLNTKIYQGPRYGHFFVIPEDNLIHLYEGTESALIDGIQVQAPPIEKPMVMIYPKEGTMIRNNIAGVVNAPWVDAEQLEAAKVWIDFLLKDEQQRAFMGSGFRPGSDLSLDDANSKIIGRYGLEANPSAPIQIPELIAPDVAAAIERSWQDVKKPGIVTFVVDVSGSMAGTKLEQANQGLTLALDSMAQNNQVGFLSFSDKIISQIPVAPLQTNRFVITNAIQRSQPSGYTALYDAVKEAIKMSDTAWGEEGAIRAVVVLTDGQSNSGHTRLDYLIHMMSVDEKKVIDFGGFENTQYGLDVGGKQVKKQDIIGTGLAVGTSYPIQIFFIGIGDDADMAIGRILAQATGAEFQGVTEKDLAKVLGEFSKYF